jgi:hypothetical protein
MKKKGRASFSARKRSPEILGVRPYPNECYKVRKFRKGTFPDDKA